MDPLRSATLIGNGIYVGMCLFVLCGLGYFLGLAPVSGPDSQLDGSIDGLIETEVPLGASTAQVKAWLVAKKVNIIVYNNKDLDYESVVVYSQFKPSQLSGIISTRLDTGRSFLAYHSTAITFFFDKKGGLIGHSIQRGSISL